LLVKAQTERERAIERIEAVLAASAARDAALRSAVAGCPPKPLTAKAFLRIAAAAKVPDAELEFFCACVHSLVAMACGVAMRHRAWQASDIKSAAKRIENAARELEAAIGKASEGARERVRLCLTAPRPTSLGPYATQARELAEAAGVAGRFERRQPWVLFRGLLTAQLLSDIERAGGKLTVSGTEGALFEIFEQLAPHLPERFRISRETLRRRWRKSRRSKQPGSRPK
jgi:hypothetical protein